MKFEHPHTDENSQETHMEAATLYKWENPIIDDKCVTIWTNGGDEAAFDLQADGRISTHVSKSPTGKIAKETLARWLAFAQKHFESVRNGTDSKEAA